MRLLIAGLQIFLVIGFIGVWIYLLKYELKSPERSEISRAFEKAFPVPDLGWLTPVLAISAVGLLMDQRFGVFFTIVAGSSFIFLGLLDISFNLQNGGYKGKVWDVIFNLVINLICMVCGPLFLVYGWMNI